MPLSYILKVPFNQPDQEQESGIAYVWLGSKSDPDEARLAEEIATELYDSVRDAGTCVVTETAAG